MKNILITQNVKYSKRRGYEFYLAKDWYDYSKKMKFNLISYDYIFKNKYLLDKKIDGLILSGGNDLNNLKKQKANYFRDKEEAKILNFFLKEKIPILCVCRGFQFITHIFGGKLSKSKSHVIKNHKIFLTNSKSKKNNFLQVNSFHNYKINHLPKNFEIIATHQDKSIEIAKYKEKILCLMFHPERKNFSQNKINNFIKEFLNI